MPRASVALPCWLVFHFLRPPLPAANRPCNLTPHQ